jgi:hypothetical protein
MTLTADDIAAIHQSIDPDGIGGNMNYNWMATAERMAMYNDYRQTFRVWGNDIHYHGGRRAAKYQAMCAVMEATFLARFGNVDLLRLAQ